MRESKMTDAQAREEFERRQAEIIVADVRKDFERRVVERMPLEAQWRLNGEFVKGRQYCFIGADHKIADEGRDYYWRQRTVYNHIAPIFETRLAKLGRIRPIMNVRPASDDENDINAATLSRKLLVAASNRLDMERLIAEGTMWSEITGTAFYKVIWDSSAGEVVGRSEEGDIREGDVSVEVCSPFEIYPSDISLGGIEEQQSLIHAKFMPVGEIYSRWGVGVKQENDDGDALVIERYVSPTSSEPQGRLTITAGDKLVYDGELPYILGEGGRRAIPFVKQECIRVPDCFFGTSVIERLIPIQRAYNAVKNRKHEFLSRLASGVLAVEEGSVDVDDLEEDGLYPGKIIVYRMGSTPPSFVDGNSVPEDFNDEEDKLLNEFVTVSGVSEILSSSSLSSRITSGVAMQLLIEQEEARMNVSSENIRFAIRSAAKFILRLYKQFAKNTRLIKFASDGGKIEAIKWKNSDLGSDDVVFEASAEVSSSAKREILFEAISAGLFNDDNGKISDGVRARILDMLGYGADFYGKIGKIGEKSE